LRTAWGGMAWSPPDAIRLSTVEVNFGLNGLART